MQGNGEVDGSDGYASDVCNRSFRLLATAVILEIVWIVFMLHPSRLSPLKKYK
jgi:hypothetical protein